MNSIEFGKACKPYNIRYHEIFGYVPCPDNYACNRDEFFQALIQAVETETELDKLIPLRAEDTDPSHIY